ncbi:MAG: hypothetical protein AB2805_14295 [Candidatus Thiodiazotropha sp.]
MSTEIFKWRMSAEIHKESVDLLRDEIIEAHSKKEPLPISIIFALLPLDSANAQEISDRGDFIITNDSFENIYHSETLGEFRDPVLKDFFIRIPEVMSGTITVTGTDIDIIFTPPMEMEISRLSELGVDRSKFQLVKGIHLTVGLSTTYMQENNALGRETWIEAVLIPGTVSELNDVQIASQEVSITGVASSMDASCQSSDPDEPNWYVYQRGTSGYCFTRYGRIAMGGQLAYTYRFGPATKEQCYEYQRLHCDS